MPTTPIILSADCPHLLPGDQYTGPSYCPGCSSWLIGRRRVSDEQMIARYPHLRDQSIARAAERANIAKERANAGRHARSRRRWARLELGVTAMRLVLWSIFLILWLAFCWLLFDAFVIH
jgi:hypothetical protein